MFNRKQRQLQRDYARVFASDEGQRVFDDLLTEFHAMRSTFDPNPYEMARMEGERNVMNYIMTRLRMTEPDYLAKMRRMPMDTVDNTEMMED